MKCLEVKSLLDQYISGDLSEDIETAVDIHLQSCEICRNTLSQLTKLSALLTSIDTSPVPSGFAGRVVACAENRKDQQPASTGFGLVRWWKKAAVPMRAAAAIFLIIGLCAGFSMARSVLSAPEPTEAPQSSSQTDPVAQYNFDYLSEAPTGSLAGSYLNLISDPDKKE